MTEAARALREELELSEPISAADVPTWIERIDALLSTLGSESAAGSQQAAGDLLIEKALLLETAGDLAAVERTLDELIARFGGDDPQVAQFAAWAWRNRIARLLGDGARDQAIAATHQLAAMLERTALEPTPAELTEQVRAVWKLLADSGFRDVTEMLLGPFFDRSLAAADQALGSWQAQLLVDTLASAYRTGDQAATERAITGLHTLGEPALAAIDEGVAQRSSALAVLLLQKVPVLVELDRAEEARAVLDQIEQLLTVYPEPQLRDVLAVLRADLDRG